MNCCEWYFIKKYSNTLTSFVFMIKLHLNGIFIIFSSSFVCFALFRNNGFYHQHFWMGLYYLNPDDGFAWSDGSPVCGLILHSSYFPFPEFLKCVV